MGYRASIGLVLGVIACGGGAAMTPVANKANAPASPVGGWLSTKSDRFGFMILCVADHTFGIAGQKGKDLKKRSAKAARIAASGKCTWAADGTGKCAGGGGMHSEFELKWKLVGDELTLDPPSDLMNEPMTFKRNADVDCDHPDPPEPDPMEEQGG